MTHDEMIAVIQAHKEGKKLEFCNSNLIWKEVIGDPCFNFFRYSYRIKPKELTREEITAKWVKDNDVKVGDRVRVILKSEKTVCWNSEMDYTIGNELLVRSISDRAIRLENNWTYDVESLKKVTPKIVQFTFEDREEFRGKWVRAKAKEDAPEGMIRHIDKSGIIVFRDNKFDYEEALEIYEFIDGRPFGKEIWE